MDNKLIIPIGIGAAALLALVAFSGKKSTSSTSGGGGGSSSGEVDIDDVDEAFSEGLIAYLNQCLNDGQIRDFTESGAVDLAAALGETVNCTLAYVESFGLPPSAELDALVNQSSSIAAGWVRYVRAAGVVGSLAEQTEGAKSEAESEGFVGRVFRGTLLDLVPFGLGQALKTRGML